MRPTNSPIGDTNVSERTLGRVDRIPSGTTYLDFWQ